MNETETALSTRTASPALACTLTSTDLSFVASPALACTLTSTVLSFHKSFHILASVRQVSTTHSPRAGAAREKKENKNGGGAVAIGAGN